MSALACRYYVQVCYPVTCCRLLPALLHVLLPNVLYDLMHVVIPQSTQLCSICWSLPELGIAHRTAALVCACFHCMFGYWVSNLSAYLSSKYVNLLLLLLKVHKQTASVVQAYHAQHAAVAAAAAATAAATAASQLAVFLLNA